jgi:triosephosphate isomerase (TIM)
MANKLKYFIGNWKMFGNQHSISILNRIHKYIAKNKDLKKRNKIIFCVPYTLIDYFSKKQNKSFIEIGAQNCHQIESFGPYTGGVNASMIKSSGANYVILGHSENRADGEDNLIIKKKIEAALKHNLNVIFCIGETQKEKNSKKTFTVLRRQIRSALNKKINPRKIIIAYEPVWSIGSGKTPNSSDLLKIVNFIKLECSKIFKKSSLIKTLYGGSVNGTNISLFSTIRQIDGFLIGGASQSSNKFIDIINNYYK